MKTITIIDAIRATLKGFTAGMVLLLFSVVSYNYGYNKSKEIVVKEDTLMVLDIVQMPVKVTSYQNTIEQCDSTPEYTADGSYIRQSSYNNWCAVSRDLLYRYINFGDTVTLWLNGVERKLVVRDIVQGNRHVDVLVPKDMKLSDMPQGEGLLIINK